MLTEGGFASKTDIARHIAVSRVLKGINTKASETASDNRDVPPDKCALRL